MLLPVDEINKFSFALAHGLGLKWKEMVAESDHRLFYPKVFGHFRGRKIVIRAFQEEITDLLGKGTGDWYHSTVFRLQIQNPTALFFQVESGENYLESVNSPKINVKSSHQSQFFQILTPDFQEELLSFWDHQQFSHFSLKGELLELELPWIVYTPDSLQRALRVLDLLSRVADRVKWLK
ncbi:MAG: hypothetical protein H6581_17825 [Bacteroidia bacterium]|nr:hypothetical protein [Bacteroidia bacterium]